MSDKSYQIPKIMPETVNVRMRKTIILFTLLLAVAVMQQAFGQQTAIAGQIDSIKTRLQQLHGADKLEALKTLVGLTSDLPEWKQNIEMYLDEARRQKNIEAEGDALSVRLRMYFQYFNADSAVIAGREAVHFARQHKLHEDLFASYQNLIKVYNALGQTLIALRSAEEAFAEARELQDKMQMARILHIMAEIYHTMGQNEQAFRYFSECLELARQDDQSGSHLIILTLNYLANLSKDMNRFGQTLQYTDSMRVEIDRFRQNHPAINMQLYDFCVDGLQAVAYAKLRQTERSLQAIRSAEAHYTQLGGGVVLDASVNEMYIAYYAATGDYNKALEYVHRAVELYANLGIIPYVIAKQDDKASVYYEKGDYRTAADTYRHIIQTKDSLNHEQFYAQINELRTIYELDKAELEAERHVEAIRRQRLVNAGLTLACLGLAIIVALVLWNRHRIAQKNRTLYHRIMEHERIAKALEKKRLKNSELLSRSGPETKTLSLTDEDVESDDDLFFGRLNLLMRDKMLFTDSELKRRDIALRIGVSDRRLHDCVKNSTGMGFTEYVNSLRLSFACELLSRKNENLTIEAIALDSGFNTRMTFYRLFRSTYGLTPEEFRKIAKRTAESQT